MSDLYILRLTPFLPPVPSFLLAGDKDGGGTGGSISGELYTLSPDTPRDRTRDPPTRSLHPQHIIPHRLFPKPKTSKLSAGNKDFELLE